MKKEHLHTSDRKAIYNIAYSNIIRIEAKRSSCIIHLEKGESILITKSMAKVCEKEIKDIRFIKTHRSHIINYDKVNLFSRKENKIVMINNDLVPLSKGQKPDFIRVYNKL